MIGFRIEEEFLDLEDSTTVQIEINNPLFNKEFEKGLLTYDITAPLSDKNQRLLKYAGMLSIRSSGRVAIPCQMWLNNQLWRVGKLLVLERSSKYKFTFKSDAGDLDALGQDRLRATDLGTAPFSTTPRGLYPQDKYALFPVVNEDFVQVQEGTPYNEYMNGYTATFNSPVVPFPYLVHVLDKVLERYGYSATGTWLSDESTRCRVIFNVIAGNSPVRINQHVPDITVGEFLKSLRKRYGLGLVFNTKSKELHLVKLQEVLDDPTYLDWTAISQRGYTWQPNAADGFTLSELIDSNDESLKDMPATYGKLVYGTGAEEVPTGIGSARLSSKGEPLVKQRGSIAGQDAKFSFRILQYQADGSSAPRGKIETWETLKTAVDGWYTFLLETEPVGLNLNLSQSHLLNLDPIRKVLVHTPEGTLKALWEKLELTLDMKGNIKAKGNFFKVMH